MWIILAARAAWQSCAVVLEKAVLWLRSDGGGWITTGIGEGGVHCRDGGNVNVGEGCVEVSKGVVIRSAA